LNSVPLNHSLKAPGPVSTRENLKCDMLVQAFAFKRSCCRDNQVDKLEVNSQERRLIQAVGLCTLNQVDP
jgi:hypothetical protein